MITYDGKAYVELDEMLEILKDDNEKTKALQERIDKAIEYIENNLYPVGNDVNGSDLPYDEAIQPLVNILRGDKE